MTSRGNTDSRPCKTYQLLGMNWTGHLGLNGAAGGDALVKLAIVSKAGQLP